MPAKFTCTFTMDSAAFHDPDGDYSHEAARILAQVEVGVHKYETGGVIRDINGNKIGSWKLR
jgi:hypothetical protein